MEEIILSCPPTLRCKDFTRGRYTDQVHNTCSSGALGPSDEIPLCLMEPDGHRIGMSAKGREFEVITGIMETTRGG
ncbi:hypothetical protein RSP03_16220 [Cereibacter sphaeroides]|jgi:hypothetical protein|nr:hypothetical protein RSP03_16220 [Cereibacter sphaeroides]